jgi:hypothetical protein
MHLSHLSTSFCSPAEKNACCRSQMHHHLHLVVVVKSSSSQCLLKHAKHEIGGWSEVWTVMVWFMVSNFSFWMVVTVAAAVCGRAFSLRRRTSLDRSPRRWLRITGFSSSSSAVLYLTCVSFFLIVLESWSIHIPEQCQKKFSGRGCRIEHFLRRRGCVSPFHGLSFGSWFIIMNKDFIFRDDAQTKLFTLIMVNHQESSAILNTLQLVFIGQLFRHPPGPQRYLRVSWMMPCADPTVMFNIVVTVSTESRLFSPIIASTRATLASLTTEHGQPETCSGTTDVRPSWKVSTHWYTFLSLIELPLYYWIILLRISLSFTSCYHKNLITENCSSLVQFSSEAAMVLALSLQLRLFFHPLHAVTTCIINISTRCSSFLKLRSILLNIQSI